MREKMFRGKTVNGNWLYGYLIKQYAYYFIQNDKGGNVAVIENTVGQFTGLTDKNGVTYCQDDIVNYYGKNYRLIFGTYQFELVGFSDSAQDDPGDFFSENAYLTGEIIGNIHDNPMELLK